MLRVAPTPKALGRVLLVEDSLVSQRVGMHMLQHLGYGVEVVGDGACAVRAAAGGTFDVILMDCQMPVLDGYAATALIREAASDHVPIIAVTAGSTDVERDRCLAAGMDDCVSKPLTAAMLSALFADWLPERAGPVLPEPVPDVPETEVLDPVIITGLKRLARSQGEDVLGRLATMFLAEAAGRMKALQRAVAQDDDEARRACAHALAGSSLGLGARKLAALCGTLERDEAVRALPEVEVELDRVVAALTPLAV